MNEGGSFRHAVCAVLRMQGIQVLSHPRAFVAIVADFFNPDSHVMAVLYAHCDDWMMRPYSQAAARGTSQALSEAAMRVELLLHEDRRVVAEDARVVAWGIACGVADYLGIVELRDSRRATDAGNQNNAAELDRRRNAALRLARGALVGGSEKEMRAALSALQALPKGDPVVEELSERVELRLQQVTNPPSVTVRFTAPGASGVPPAPITCASGGIVVLPGPGGLSKGDGRFVGWVGAPGSVGPLSPGFRLTVANDVTLMALWEDAVTQTVGGMGGVSKDEGGKKSRHKVAETVFLIRLIVGLLIVVCFLGSLSCNGRGTSGSSTSHTSSSVKETALDPKEAAKIASIAAGSYHTFALRKDGKVYVTGMDQYGERDVNGWRDVAALSSGHVVTLGLTRDGTVLAEGSSRDNVCDVAGLRDVIAVSAGDEHAVVLCEDGSVIAKGENEDGRCDVASWKGIVAIAAGSSHTVGLREDGTVVATGNNESGQCNVSTWTDVVDISAGSGLTVGLRADGTVLATGKNDDGQCDVSAWSGIKAISAGWAHTVALRNDGTVVATGENMDGQCDVSGWADVVAISAGGYHTVALTKDGKILATGYNGHGECDVAGWGD